VLCSPRSPIASAAAAPRTDRDAANASALAPRARAPQVGAAAATSGPPADRRSDATARVAFRPREPWLGLAADRRRAAQTRHARVAEHDQAHPARQPAWAPHRGAQAQAGRNSSAGKRPACSPLTYLWSDAPVKWRRCSRCVVCLSMGPWPVDGLRCCRLCRGAPRLILVRGGFAPAT
jgi:hypothetical protein